MYGTLVNKDGSLDSFLDYGDNYPLPISCYDDAELSIPTNLIGKAFTLGIETEQGVSVCEIDAVISGNLLVFNIDYDIYKGKAEEGKTYRFDYWEKNFRKTAVPLSKIEFRRVAHKTDIIEEV